MPRTSNPLHAAHQELQLVTDLVLSGNDDELLAKPLERMSELLRRGIPDERIRLSVQARVAQLNLLLMRLDRAAEALSPYAEFTSRGRLRFHDASVEDLIASGENSFEVALALTQLANLAYRACYYPRGVEIAKEARRLLRDKCQDAPRDLKFLAEFENEIWLARLEWHCGSYQEAENILRLTLRELTKELRNSTLRGGIELLAAVALGMWASFDWRSSNKLRDARRKAFQAAFILSQGIVKSSIRLAHCLYMAGRIEASYSLDSVGWWEELYNNAEEIFRRHHHIFQLRVRMQKALCLIGYGDIDQARQILDDLDKKMAEATQENTDFNSRIYPKEMEYVLANNALGRVWIKEYEARKEPAKWEECVELAAAIEEQELQHPRLRAEGQLHYGLALTKCGKNKQETEGRAILEDTILLAQKHNLTKIEIAARFALVESFVSHGGDNAKAQSHWDLATDLLREVRSSFLFRWKSTLGPDINTLNRVEVEINQTFEEAVSELAKKYLKYHSSRSNKKAALWNTIGVTPTKGYRLLEKYNVDLKN